MSNSQLALIRPTIDPSVHLSSINPSLFLSSALCQMRMGKDSALGRNSVSHSGGVYAVSAAVQQPCLWTVADCENGSARPADIPPAFCSGKTVPWTPLDCTQYIRHCLECRAALCWLSGHHVHCVCVGGESIWLEASLYILSIKTNNIVKCFTTCCVRGEFHTEDGSLKRPIIAISSLKQRLVHTVKTTTSDTFT